MTTIRILRRSGRGREYACSLYVRLIHRRRVSTLTLPYRLYASEWDAKNQCIIRMGADTVRRRELSLMSAELSKALSRLEDIISQLKNRGEYTCSDIVDAYRLTSNEKSLTNFSDKLYADLVSRSRERTARAYRTVSRGLIAFSGKKDLLLTDLDCSLIKQFETDLKNRGRAANTISYYMRNLRAIYHRAVHCGLIPPASDNPFSDVYTGVQVTRKRALSCEDINRLYRLDVLSGQGPIQESRRLLEAQRLFFFSFHARGMSFVDMAYLRKSNLRLGVLSYFRKKTGQLIEVKITPYMQSIINYFSDRSKGSQYVFPIIRQGGGPERLQYETGLRLQNKRLARLSQLAGVRDKVTTHVARHSWATMAKKENLPLWVISEGLGHSNEKTTYTYLASFERSVLDTANERISTLIDRGSSHPLSS